MFKKVFKVLIISVILLASACTPVALPSVPQPTVTVTRVERIVETVVVTNNVTIPCPPVSCLPTPEPAKPLRWFNTLAELNQFVFEDKTKEQKYIPGEFMCYEFAEIMIRNAAAKGFKMYWYPCKDMISNYKDHLRVITVVLNDCDTEDEWYGLSCPKYHKAERNGRVYAVEPQYGMVIKYDVID